MTEKFVFQWRFGLNSWIAAKEELEDFQISSRELESELDAQLEQLELQTKDLQTSLVKLEQENEILRVSGGVATAHSIALY